MAHGYFSFIRSLSAKASLFLFIISPHLWGQTLTQSVDTGSGFSSGGTSNVGDEIIYRLQYTFPGITSGFNNVVVTDTLDPSLEYLSLVNSPHIQSSSYNPTTRTVTFNFINNLPSGATGEIRIRTRFPNGTFTGTQASNTATMSGDGIPGGSLNATPTNIVVTAVNGTDPPGLSNGVLITKTASANPVHLGSGLTYTIQHGNLGGQAVDNYVIEETLPPEFILERFRHSQDFGANLSFTVTYQTNLNASFQTWGTFDTNPPTGNGNQNVSSLGLAAGEFITVMRYDFGTVPAGSDFIYATGANISLTGDVTTKFLNGTPNDVDGNPVTTGSSFDNVATLTTNQYSPQAATATSNIEPDETYLRVTKDITDPTIETGQIVPTTIGIRSPLRNVGNLVNPVIYELLPPEMEYVGGLSVESAGRSPAGFTPSLPTLEAIANWDNTGRTLIKLSWDTNNPLTITPNTDNWGVDVTFNLQVPFGVAEGSYSNEILVGLDNPHLCQNENLASTDQYDFDQDGDRNEVLCANSDNFEVFLNGNGVGLNSQKWVKGQCDTEFSRFPSFGSTVPGGRADYEIRISNPSTKAVREIDILDILPFVGDTGVIDPSARLTEWTPVLSGPVSFDSASLPAGISGVQIFYSTSSEPNHDLGVPNTPPDPAFWNSTPPSNITLVRSLLLRVNGVLQPGEDLVLSFPMRAPIDAPTDGEIAWNSFGFSATDNDNNSRLLPTEPIKVGITTKPIVPPSYGDFVWFDTNRNGIQEPSESGINGVRVELYSTTNATADPTIDTLVDSTVTQTSFGKPGAYLFTGFPAGSYYAVFYPPAGYNASPADQGSNDSFDSDGIASTLGGNQVFITALTTMTNSSEDPTWDQGFYTDNAGITLGDFVWADTTANGLQDPQESGIGGVVVKLLNSTGTEIGTTTTSPNGFYLFGGPNNDSLNTVSSTTSSTIDLAISTSDDDVAQNTTGGGLNPTATEHKIVLQDGAAGNIRTFGLRFNLVPIPPGATITDACIQFTANSGSSGQINGGSPAAAPPTAFSIAGDASANAAPFTNTASGPINRTPTSASVPWENLPRWSAGERLPAQKTPNLSAIIQEIIDLDGWAANNSIALLISGTSGQREALSFDGTSDAAQRPILSITYEVTTTSQITLQPSQDYTICIDTTQASLNGFTLAPTGTDDTSNDPATDTDDSDAIPSGNDAVISYTPPSDPTFNMSLDTGFQLSGPITKPTSFPLWQATNSLGGANGPLDNADNDLFSNLLEYGLCLKPDTGLKVTPDGTTANDGLCIRESGVGSQLEVFYTRPEGVTDLTYDLLLSTNGTTWNPETSITPTIVSNGDGTETVTHPNVTSLGSSGLLALRVTLTSGSDTYTSTTPTCGWNQHPVALACETFSNPFTKKSVFDGSGTFATATRVLDLSSSLSSGDDLSTVLPNLGTGPSSQTVYLVEVVDGIYEGHYFEIASATATSVTLRNDVDLFAPAPCNSTLTIPDLTNAQVIIYPLPTINELFPVSEFQSGPNSNAADNILLHDPVTQTFVTYYLLNDPGGDQWVRFGSITDMGNTPICPGQGSFTHAKTSTSTQLQFGCVRHWDLLTPLPQGYTLIGGAHPVASTPQLRNLLTLKGTTDPSTADQVITWRGDTDPNHLCYDGYFYALGGSINQWVAVNDNSLTNLNTSPLFQPDRSIIYCIRDAGGKTDYKISSPVTRPANTRP